MLVFVEVSSVSLVQRSVNSTGGATFGMVERKIPAIAALAASGDSDIPGVVDMKESVAVTLMECTCLLRNFMIRSGGSSTFSIQNFNSSQETPEQTPVTSQAFEL